MKFVGNSGGRYKFPTLIPHKFLPGVRRSTIFFILGWNEREEIRLFYEYYYTDRHAMTLDVNNDLVVKSIARVNITNYQSLEVDLYFSRSPKEYRAPTRFSKNIIELIT